MSGVRQNANRTNCFEPFTPLIVYSNRARLAPCGVKLAVPTAEIEIALASNEPRQSGPVVE